MLSVLCSRIRENSSDQKVSGHFGPKSHDFGYTCCLQFLAMETLSRYGDQADRMAIPSTHQKKRTVTGPTQSPDVVDTIVIGGGFAGCLTALACAEKGQRVVLVERRPYLGREVTAKLRPWMNREGLDEISSSLRSLLLPEGEAREVDIAPAAWPDCFAGEMPLFCGSIKKTLLAALHEKSVAVLLMCHVAGVLADDTAAQGVLLASKYGLQILRGNTIVDLSERRKTARLMGQIPAADSTLARYTIGLSGVSTPPAATLDLPSELGVDGECVWLHPGKCSSCNMFVELAFRPTSAEDGAFAATAREIEARQLAVRVTKHLEQHVECFEGAVVLDLAAETLLDGPLPSASARPLPNLLLPQMALPSSMSCADLNELHAGCHALAGEVAGLAPGAGGPTDAAIRCGVTAIPLGDCTITPFDDPKLPVRLQSVSFDFERFLPIGATGDVLVAGGGTAGACAGIAAAEEGAEVIVSDVNPDLGGTQTLGLVLGYYYGYRDGFTKILDERVAAFAQTLCGGGRAKRVAKMLCYEQEIVDRGGRLLLNTVMAGAVVRDGRLTGAVAVNDEGISIVSANVTIDATGDGDLAVFAGAKHTYGNPRNGNVQDYSQWGRGNVHWTSKSKDLDVIDHRKLSELLRGLTMAHADAPYYDFAPMLTVREARHIEGDYTLDLVDIYEGRAFDDAIAVASSDWDPHGISSSWLGRLGFMPVHLRIPVVQIPYRSCLPKGLDGLLVSAKAISATTDAACYCRMAPDIQNLGYATGLAAAMAAAQEGRTRDIDVSQLRARLLDLAIVSDECAGDPEVTGSAQDRVRRLASGDEMALFGVALLPKADALPLLDAQFHGEGTGKLCLAKALAWFGSKVGLDLLIANLEELNDREGGTPYDDTHPHKLGNPKAGIVDEVDDYWRINQLLALLGILADPAAVPTVAKIVDKATAGGGPKREANTYIKHRIDMQRVPHFDRLLCIAFALERLADPRLVPAADRLLDRPHVTGYLSTTNDRAGLNYHGAYAEVSLAAAATRCGSVKAVTRLAAYLGDVHEILSTFAYRELCEVTGQDRGRRSAAWQEWLSEREVLIPVRYTGTQPVF